MESTLNVNQIGHLKAKVLLLLAVLIIAGCMTTQATKTEQNKQEEILEHQLSIIINHLNYGEPEKAHFETRPLLKQYPDRSEIQNLMGLAYMGMKQAKLAEGYFRKAFDLKPDPAFGLNLTSALIEQRRYREAIKLCKGFLTEGLEEYKYPERFNHNIALAYERMNRSKFAIKYYRQALAKNPSNFQTLMQLGRLYERLNRIKHAEPIYKRAADVCLKCYEPVKRRSDVLVKLGRKAEATQMLVDFLETQEIRPQDYTLAKKYVSQLDPTALQNHKKK
jgi:Tfp pilus assembly protein PilF